MLSLVAVYIQNRKRVLGIITSKKTMKQTFLKTIAKLTFIPIAIIRYITSLNDIWKSRIILLGRGGWVGAQKTRDA